MSIYNKYGISAILMTGWNLASNVLLASHYAFLCYLSSHLLFPESICHLWSAFLFQADRLKKKKKRGGYLIGDFSPRWINLRLRPLLSLQINPEIWRGFQDNWCHTISQDQISVLFENIFWNHPSSHFPF